MRLCAVQFFSVVGNLAANFHRMEAWVMHAKQLSCDAVIFPECALVGYLPQDLVLDPEFRKQHNHYLLQVSALSHRLYILVGSIDEGPWDPQRRLYNAMHLCHEGHILHSVYKTRLPNDDVFYDSRFFAPNPNPGASNIISLGSLRLGVGICEDMWHNADLFDAIAKNGTVHMWLSASASPYHISKTASRLAQVKRILKAHAHPFLFLNQVASYDGILFDGQSFVTDAEGIRIAQAPGFEECGMVLDITDGGDLSSVHLTRIAVSQTLVPVSPPDIIRPQRITVLSQGLEFGIRNFVLGCGLSKAVVCVSGGIDSALVLILSKRALGAENCFALILPTPFNKRSATLDAIGLCHEHRIPFRTIPIAPLLRPLETVIAKEWGHHVHTTTLQNIQARMRGLIAMIFANEHHACLMGTSNKDELAMGYATLYGDMCAGLLPIGDVLKSQIYTLTDYYRHSLHEYIPEGIIRRPPSAELVANQKDSDDLPSYEELCPAIAATLVKELSLPHHPSPLMEQVQTALSHSQFKRKQAAPILKVSFRDLGRGRQTIISGGSPHTFPLEYGTR